MTAPSSSVQFVTNGKMITTEHPTPHAGQAFSKKHDDFGLSNRLFINLFLESQQIVRAVTPDPRYWPIADVAAIEINATLLTVKGTIGQDTKRKSNLRAKIPDD
jgi:hypothetical protein